MFGVVLLHHARACLHELDAGAPLTIVYGVPLVDHKVLYFAIVGPAGVQTFHYVVVIVESVVGLGGMT